MKEAVAPRRCSPTHQEGQKTSIKCGVVDKTMIDVAGVQALSELREEVLIAKMMGKPERAHHRVRGVLKCDAQVAGVRASSR